MSFKPGQTVRCTITLDPKTEAAEDTLLRLMRQDVALKRSLRKSHRRRQQDMVVYNRGNRDWYKRERVGDQVRAIKGATWTMPFSVHLEPDIRSVEKYLKITGA